MTWRERIAAAKLRGKFTDEDAGDANAWRTCKLGERFGNEPEYGGAILQREQGEALRLGVAFGDAVIDDQFDKAARLCAKIDQLKTWRKEA